MLLPDVLPPDPLHGLVRLVVHKALSLPEVVDLGAVLVVIGEDHDGHLRYVGSPELAPSTETARGQARRRTALAAPHAARWAMAWRRPPERPLPDRDTVELVIDCGLRGDERAYRFVSRCSLADRLMLGPRGDIRYDGVAEPLPKISRA
jgi:hypothetical protein